MAAQADGPGAFEGRASTFGTVDSYGDTIEPGAYRDTLPQFLTRGFIGWGHDWQEPIGYVDRAEERMDGLYLAGTFHSDADAQKYRVRAAERMAAGKFMGLSIGYEAEEFEYRKVAAPVRGMFGELTDKVRVLTKIKLFEVSFVTVPAEENSGVTAMKGHGLPFAEHSEHVRVAVREWLERVRSGSELRAQEKVGRPISEARRARMSSVSEQIRTAADEIDTMLEETAPQKAADAVQEFLRYQQFVARRNGVAI